jgi:uncharacterized membrane-anchored protein YitT (DUF2179 family)
MKENENMGIKLEKVQPKVTKEAQPKVKEEVQTVTVKLEKKNKVQITEQHNPVKKIVSDYLLITFSVILIMMGSYYFKFPNDFTFGGVTGLSVVIGKLKLMTPGTANLAINMILLIIGFFFLGRGFGVKTIYSSLLLSFGLYIMEFIDPVTVPLTDEPFLELIFAVALPAAGAAILFRIGASGGGTDIIAMIINKYLKIPIGKALLWSDVLITLSAVFILSFKTFLFSVLGMFLKSFVIDDLIESMNQNKYMNIICSKPDIICEYITHELKRSATICQAEGAYSHTQKNLILTAMKPAQANKLRAYLAKVDPTAFTTIIKTSEITGKGFLK